jgi:large subunit ribosomal protein L13
MATSTSGNKSVKKSETKAKTLSKANKKRVVKSKRAAVRTASKTTLRTVKKKTTAKKTAARPKVKPEGHAPHSARITANRGEVKAIASRTQFLARDEDKRNWLLIDAKGQTVGRLASQIANILRGKHKPTFTPNNDVGDFVVVINAEQLKFTSNKEEKKNYHYHTGFIGGLKTVSAGQVREKHPERLLEFAVKGMIPRNPLGRRQILKLKIYKGDKHPHAAQNPQAWELRYDSAVVAK